ncbi:unnamed protein product [Choristocarpus tenellus]
MERNNRPFWAKPGEDFELRVIVYTVKDWKQPADETSGQTDMFIRCRALHHGWQNTDTHLQALNFANFNWRFKFHLRLPDADTLDNNLTFEVYDWDALGNTLLGYANVDLKEFLDVAELYRAPLHFFKRKIDKQIMAARVEERRLLEEQTMAVKAKAAAKAAAKKAAEEASELMEENQGLMRAFSGAYGATGNLGMGLVKGVGNVANATVGTTVGVVGTVGSAVGDVTMGVVGGVGAGLSGIGARRKKKKPSMWQNIKTNMGFGPLPAHSAWVPVKHLKPRKGGGLDHVTVGQLLISVEVMPKVDAKRLNNAGGRGLPNEFPVLEPPEGRPDPMKLFNPLEVLKACVMDGLIGKFASIIALLAIAYIFCFTFPTIVAIIELVDDLPFGGWILFGLFLWLICVTSFACGQCAKACGCNEPDDDDDDCEA